MQCSCQNGGNGKAKDQDCDEALSVMLSGKFNGKGRFERKPCGVCWNCEEKGHFKDKCLKPATDKKNDSPKSKSSTAIESDSEDKGVFFMEPAFGSDSDGNKSDDGGYGSNNDNSWFSERGSDRAGSDWETEELSGVDGSEHGLLVDIDLDSVVATEPDELAALVGVGKVGLSHAKIYDSSCFKHLTPYCDTLENFVKIPPKIFQAANKQTMSAVGMGEMIINVPNGADISQLRLTEVLYSPEVGYTLVSVGQLDEKGFKITFSGSKCSIKRPDGKRVGAVPKTMGLYHVAYNEPKTAHVADKELTLDQFHC